MFLSVCRIGWPVSFLVYSFFFFCRHCTDIDADIDTDTNVIIDCVIG